MLPSQGCNPDVVGWYRLASLAQRRIDVSVKMSCLFVGKQNLDPWFVYKLGQYAFILIALSSVRKTCTQFADHNLGEYKSRKPPLRPRRFFGLRDKGPCIGSNQSRFSFPKLRINFALSGYFSVHFFCFSRTQASNDKTQVSLWFKLLTGPGR